MRSTIQTPYTVIRFNEDASITYLCNNNKWTKNNKLDRAKTQALCTKLWLNSGNAWNCIAKLTRAKAIPFKELFVAQGLELTPFTEADAMTFACLLSVTSDQGEIDALAYEALEEKSNQIMELEETLTELRVAMIHGSED